MPVGQVTVQDFKLPALCWVAAGLGGGGPTPSGLQPESREVGNEA
jgi:hypothetical protein